MGLQLALSELPKISSPKPLQQSSDVNVVQLRQLELDENAKLSEESEKPKEEEQPKEEKKSSNVPPQIKWLFQKVAGPIKNTEEENTGKWWAGVNFGLILLTLGIIIAIIFISAFDWADCDSERLASLKFNKRSFDDLVNEVPSSCKENATCKKALANVEKNRNVSLCHELATISIFHIEDLLEKLGESDGYKASIGTNQTELEGEDRITQMEAKLAQLTSYVERRLSFHDEVLIRYLKIALYENYCKLVHKAFQHTADLIQRLISSELSLLTIPIAVYWGRGNRSRRAFFGVITVVAALLSLILELKKELRSMPIYIVRRVSEAALPIAISLFLSTFT